MAVRVEGLACLNAHRIAIAVARAGGHAKSRVYVQGVCIATLDATLGSTGGRVTLTSAAGAPQHLLLERQPRPRNGYRWVWYIDGTGTSALYLAPNGERWGTRKQLGATYSSQWRPHPARRLRNWAWRNNVWTRPPKEVGRCSRLQSKRPPT
jgi:hypothetical protein